MSKFQPKISKSESDTKESSSINCLEHLLEHDDIVTHLKKGDKEANIDGRIELLENRRFIGNFAVQIKTLPKKYRQRPRFEIPTSLLAYADRTSEITLLIAVDKVNKIAYWKHISRQLIIELDSKLSQNKVTVEFDNNEILNENSVDSVIERWKGINSRNLQLLLHGKSSAR